MIRVRSCKKKKKKKKKPNGFELGTIDLSDDLRDDSFSSKQFFEKSEIINIMLYSFVPRFVLFIR